MSGSPLDIFVKKNNDVKLIFTAKTPNGDAVDMTGFTAKWAMKKRHESNAAIVKASDSLGGIEITDADEGVFEVTIDAEDTKFLAAGIYLHEATITDALGKSVSLMDLNGSWGTLTLIDQITPQD
jgi:hypothetical protein